jgi:hypothetical protein
MVPDERIITCHIKDGKGKGVIESKRKVCDIVF